MTKYTLELDALEFKALKESVTFRPGSTNPLMAMASLAIVMSLVLPVCSFMLTKSILLTSIGVKPLVVVLVQGIIWISGMCVVVYISRKETKKIPTRHRLMRKLLEAQYQQR